MHTENQERKKLSLSGQRFHSVSYTHLDVYKRQPLWNEKVHSSRYCIVGFLKRCCKNLKHGAENKRAKKDGSSQARKRKHVLKRDRH